MQIKSTCRPDVVTHSPVQHRMPLLSKVVSACIYGWTMHTTAWSNMPPSPLSVQSQLIWRWTDAGSKRIAIVKLQRCDSLTPLLDILHLAAKAHASNQARLGWRFMAGEGDSHAGGWWLVFVMCQSASKQGVHRLSQSWSVLVSEPQAQSLATLTSGVRELRCQSDQASNVCAPGWLRSGECPTSERQPPIPIPVEHPSQERLPGHSHVH